MRLVKEQKKGHSILSRKALRQWLQGQKSAAHRIQQERCRWLLQLSPEQAFKVYLSLQNETHDLDRRLTEPSPVLYAMRRTIERYTKAQQKEQ